MNNPIGIFDSGLGGLTVLREMQAAMPHEHFVYVADSAFAPYGNKDSETVLQRSLHIAKELQQTHDIKALVVACNTATAAAVHQLREILNIPVIGMEPALKPAVEQSKSGIVGILATENTLQSDKFSNLLDAHQHQARILTQPCAGLVEAIEQGELHSGKTKGLLASYVLPLVDEGVDTLVLGCTHYPWFEPMIRGLVGNDVTIISTGKAVAKQVQKKIQPCDVDEAGKTSWLTTGDVRHVSAMASLLLQRDVLFKPLPQVCETVIMEFELEKRQQLLFQALLQAEDGLAFVRCVHGVQQLWTTSLQVEALKDWLKCLPKSFNLCILQEYVWTGDNQ